MRPASRPAPPAGRPDWPYPRVIAHRGGGALAPENTLAALDAAQSHGLAMIECDVKLSADGVPFLLHDDTLERTSDGTGAAAAQRYETLAQLDAGSWFDARFAGVRMPTLAAVAAHCEAAQLAANIEIKPSPGHAEQTGRVVAEQARRLWRALPPLLSSFNVEALASARGAAPALRRGLLFERLPDDWREQATALDCFALHVNHRYLDAATAHSIRAAGWYLFAYTVNEPARARELHGWGVDAICTDRIDLIGGDFFESAQGAPRPPSHC